MLKAFERGVMVQKRYLHSIQALVTFLRNEMYDYVNVFLDLSDCQNSL